MKTVKQLKDEVFLKTLRVKKLTEMIKEEKKELAQIRTDLNFAFLENTKK